jgi:hypothetical protein
MKVSRFSIAFSCVTLLVTLVIATGIWDGSFPDADRENLRQRKAYYERVLRKADVSWKEGLYYRALDGGPRKP